MDVDTWNNKNGTLSDEHIEKGDVKIEIDVENNKDVDKSDDQADPPSPEQKYPTFWQNLKQYVWEYSSRTTVHGLGYLGERGRTIFERIFWIISMQITFYLCIVLVMKTYDKWTTSPVIVTLATAQTPIWEIPFPAVTICPEIKSVKERYNFTDVFLKKMNNIELTEAEELEYQYMLLICINGMPLFDWNQATINDSAIDFLNKVAPDLRTIIFDSRWKATPQLKDFSPVLTSEGICYTFNGLDKSELFTDIVTIHEDLFSTNGKQSNWSLELGYLSTAENFYPERSYLPGASGGLDLYLDLLLKDIDVTCGLNKEGFKIMLHNPEEVPYVVDKFFQVPRRHSVTVAVKPNMMTTADDLKNYSPTERQCYFAEEKHLKYFKVYNQANCINECYINIFLEICGCVGFYMPRQKSTPICSMAKYIDCNFDLLRRNDEARYLIDMKVSKDSLNRKKCECLPSCTSLDFEFELSQTQWTVDESLKIIHPGEYENYQNSGNYSYVSNLNVFFKNMQFIKYERHELYGQAEFWANCGGLLSLFTGFSFLSVLEILYYLTLRLACNLYKFGRRYWSGTEEILETRGREKTNIS